MIPYGRQDVTQEDIEAVTRVLQSDFLTQGPKVPEFEGKVAALTNSRHGVAVNSATSALHVSCLALGIGEGDLVWTSPITFVASANAARLCGASVDFVDIEPGTFNICPEKFEAKLVAAARVNCLPKALIAVHMCGQSPDMARISELAREYQIRLIEDASHAIGARYRGEPVGCCHYSDIAVFSFHPVKIITTLEGGMAMTNDRQLADAMIDYRSHGVTRDEARMRSSSHGPWYYEQLRLGLNYRLTDLAAALGSSQLDRLSDYVIRRNAIADRYDASLADLPLDLPKRNPDCYSSFHLYVIRLKDVSAHRAVFERLREDGIGVNLHYIPVHLQPYYRDLGFERGDFPNAEDYYERAISIPIYPKLTSDDQNKIVTSIERALNDFC